MRQGGEEVPITFLRTMGCGDAELVRWLPAALQGADIHVTQDASRGGCLAVYDDGTLHIDWRVLPPRQIALLCVPQLEVRFSYSGLSVMRRRDIQRYFDQVTHRGGG